MAELTGNQLAERIMNKMNVQQLERLLRVIELSEQGKHAQLELYWKNIPTKDKVKIFGYFAALDEGDEVAGV